MLTLNKNIKLILNSVAGPLVFSILLYSIYIQLQHQQAGNFSIQRLLERLDARTVTGFLLVCLLMLVNWGIEARKWQLSLNGFADLSFATAFKAILSGTTLAFFTPNRVGEYFGRMAFLDDDKKISSLSFTFICSAAQLLVTLAAGALGILVLRHPLANLLGGDARILFWLKVTGSVCLIAIAVLTFLYFRLKWVIKWFEKVPVIKKWFKAARVLEDVNATLLLRILSLSFLRYLVFMAQYYLMFTVFGVEMEWWQAFWSLSLVFLLVALVPGMGVLTELGIRWKSGIQLMQMFSPDIGGILAVSVSIWIVNMVVPAVAGGLFLLRLKIFRK